MARSAADSRNALAADTSRDRASPQPPVLLSGPEGSSTGGDRGGRKTAASPAGRAASLAAPASSSSVAHAGTGYPPFIAAVSATRSSQAPHASRRSYTGSPQ